MSGSPGLASGGLGAGLSWKFFSSSEESVFPTFSMARASSRAPELMVCSILAVSISWAAPRAARNRRKRPSLRSSEGLRSAMVRGWRW